MTGSPTRLWLQQSDTMWKLELSQMGTLELSQYLTATEGGTQWSPTAMGGDQYANSVCNLSIITRSQAHFCQGCHFGHGRHVSGGRSYGPA